MPVLDAFDSPPLVERDPVAYAIGACHLLPPPSPSRAVDCDVARKGDPTGVLRFDMYLHIEGTTVWWKKYADCNECYIPHNRSVGVRMWWLVEASLDAGGTWSEIDTGSTDCTLTSRTLWCARSARKWDCPRELGHAAMIRASGAAQSTTESGVEDSPQYMAEYVCN